MLEESYTQHNQADKQMHYAFLSKDGFSLKDNLNLEYRTIYIGLQHMITVCKG